MAEQIHFARGTQTLAPEDEEHLPTKLIRRALKASQATWPTGHARIILDVVPDSIPVRDFESYTLRIRIVHGLCAPQNFNGTGIDSPSCARR